MGQSRAVQRSDVQSAMESLYDQATGLPGPGLFFDRAERAMLIAAREELNVAIIIAQITGTGARGAEPATDAVRLALLQKMGARFQEAVRVSDSVAVIRMDTLGVLLPHVAVPGLPVVLRRVLETTQRRVDVQPDEYVVKLSVGIALQPDGSSDVSELMNSAWENLASRRAGTDG